MSWEERTQNSGKKEKKFKNQDKLEKALEQINIMDTVLVI